MERLKSQCGQVVDQYLQYKSHVCREVYASGAEIVAKKLSDIEETWPMYENAGILSARPNYQQQKDKQWRQDGK